MRAGSFGQVGGMPEGMAVTTPSVGFMAACKLASTSRHTRALTEAPLRTPATTKNGEETRGKASPDTHHILEKTKRPVESSPINHHSPAKYSLDSSSSPRFIASGPSRLRNWRWRSVSLAMLRFTKAALFARFFATTPALSCSRS